MGEALLEEEHPLLKQAQKKGREMYQRDSWWVGGGKIRNFTAGQQVTRMFAGWEFWGLNDGICLFVATEVSLAEEDFFSSIPDAFQNQTPALLMVYCTIKALPVSFSPSGLCFSPGILPHPRQGFMATHHFSVAWAQKPHKCPSFQLPIPKIQQMHLVSCGLFRQTVVLGLWFSCCRFSCHLS